MAQKADVDPSFFQAAKPTFGFSPPKVMVKKITSVQVEINGKPRSILQVQVFVLNPEGTQLTWRLLLFFFFHQGK